MSACGHADGGTWGRMYRERRVCVKCHRWSSWNLSDGFWLNQGISFLIISAVIRKPLGELCQYVSNTQMSMELGLAWLLLYIVCVCVCVCPLAGQVNSESIGVHWPDWCCSPAPVKAQTASLGVSPGMMKEDGRKVWWRKDMQSVA